MSSAILNAKPTYFPEVVFLGDKRVGKTSLIQNLAGERIDPTNESRTLAKEFLQVNMTIGRSNEKILAGVRLYDSHFAMFDSPPSLSR